MSQIINKEIESYLELTEEGKQKLIAKLGLHKNVGLIREIISERCQNVSRKVIRAIHNDTVKMIQSNYELKA